MQRFKKKDLNRV